MKVALRNRGTGESDASTLRFFLSDDSIITGRDIEVVTEQISALDPLGNLDKILSLVAPTQLGTYHYGICVDAVPSESDTTNNCSEAIAISVNPLPPDLVVESPMVNDSSPLAGQPFTFGVTVRNRGTGSADSATLRYLLSDDSTITPEDFNAGVEQISALGPSESSDESVNLIASNEPGTYHYGVCVDPVPGDSDSANNCSDSVVVNVRPLPPDLVVDLPEVDDDSPLVGQSFSLRVTVRNWGIGDSDATTLKYLLSEDSIITFEDSEVGTDRVTYLDPSESSVESVNLIGPTEPGTYHYGVCIDPVPGESDATNNCSDAVVITMLPRQPDIVVATLAVNESNPYEGETITLRVTVRNQGTGTSGTTTMKYLLSEDSAITSEDFETGVEQISALRPLEISDESVSLNAALTEGTLYFGTCVDPVPDESDTANNCSDAVAVNILPLPPVLMIDPQEDEDQALTYIPSLDARVLDLRFYERGAGPTSRDERIYTNVFSKLSTRYISWELNLAYPRQPQETDFTIESVYYRPNGSIFFRNVTKKYIGEGWSNSWHTSGLGWERPGNWRNGTYRVELFIEEQLVASGEFHVIFSPILDKDSHAAIDRILEWGAARRTLEERSGRLALEGMMEIDSELAISTAVLPWVRTQLTGKILRFLHTLAIMARRDVSLAKWAVALPWVEDGLTDDEELALRTLALLAVNDPDVANDLIRFKWLNSNMSSSGAKVVVELGDIARMSGEAFQAIGGMPYLQTIEPADALASKSLRRLLFFEGEHFEQVMDHIAIADGIVDEETKIVATLYGVSRKNPDLLNTLLDPDQVTLQDRTISLPLAGEVKLTILRTRPGADRTMGQLEAAVRQVEAVMGLPFPSRHVIYLFEEATSSSHSGVFGGTNFGTHIVSLPSYDDVAFDSDFLFRHLAHEVAHYYWTGNRSWLDEGAANLIEAVAAGLEYGRTVAPKTEPCAYAQNIAGLEGLVLNQQSLEFDCNYSLGERLFHNLYDSLGVATFSRGFSRLYLLSQSDDPNDDCIGVRLNICHLRAAFTIGIPNESGAIASRVLDRWYEGDSAQSSAEY